MSDSVPDSEGDSDSVFVVESEHKVVSVKETKRETKLRLRVGGKLTVDLIFVCTDGDIFLLFLFVFLDLLARDVGEVGFESVVSWSNVGRHFAARCLEWNMLQREKEVGAVYAGACLRDAAGEQSSLAMRGQWVNVIQAV